MSISISNSKTSDEPPKEHMNISKFEYTGYHSNVFFGENSFNKVSQLLSPYKKAFVIAGNRLDPYVDNLKKNLGAERIAHFNKIEQHVPLELIEEAREKQITENTEVLVA